MNKTQLLSTIGLLGSLATSQAAWSLLDDFESYTTGNNISTENPTNWSNDTADGTIGEASGNKYLIQGGTTNAHTVFNSGSTLLDGANTGTYFFRASMPAAGSHQGAAFSNRDGFAEGWSDAKGIVRFGGDGGGLGQTIYAYDSSTYSSITADADVSTWYNFWVVIDNAAETYDVYMQSEGDADFASQTQVADDYGFRKSGTNTGATASIEALFFRTANDGSEARFDDLYFDGSGQNLANPVPEPTVSLLGALGLLGLLRRRR
jgi:hypothetical protein